MFNLLLVLAFTGIIVISAGFAGVTFLQSVQSGLDAQITSQRLIEVAAQIQSHMRYLDPAGGGDGYILALPKGTIGTGVYAYNQVPSFVTGNARSANGVPFEYCPTAPTNAGGTAGTITMASGTTYNIGTYMTNSVTSASDTSAITYVTGNGGSALVTGLPPMGGSVAPYGVLVAAAPNQFYPPDCSSVTTDSSGAHAVVSGGIVAVINDDNLNKMNIASSMSDLRFYVNSTPTGDCSGHNSSNQMAFSDALTIIKTLKPASATIYLNPVGATPVYSTSENFSYGGRLTLASYQGASANAVIQTSGDITLDEYSRLSLSGVTLKIGSSGTNTLTVNGTLEMADTSPIITGNVNVYGTIKGYAGSTMTVNGNVTVDNGGVITSSGPMVFNNLGNRGFKVQGGGRVYGGTAMTFNPAAANIVPIDIKAGGDLVAGSGIMTINDNSGGLTMTGGMIVDPGGRFIGPANSTDHPGSSVMLNNVSAYGFYVHGEMDLMPAANSAAIKYHNLPTGGLSAGIVLASGGKFVMNATTGVTIGESANRPIVGIQDNGGSQFITVGATGTNIVYASTTGTCWQGASSYAHLFLDSQAGTANGNSAAAQTTTPGGGWYRLYNNSSNLTCQRT